MNFVTLELFFFLAHQLNLERSAFQIVKTKLAYNLNGING